MQPTAVDSTTLLSPSGQAPSNATNAPTYAPSSLVKDGGTMVPSTSLSLAATVAPVDIATPATSAEMLMTFFVKLNNYFRILIYLPVCFQT